MHPFARQLLGWQATNPERRAAALVLEVKCRKVRDSLDWQPREPAVSKGEEEPAVKASLPNVSTLGSGEGGAAPLEPPAAGADRYLPLERSVRTLVVVAVRDIAVNR